jgi:hypothetical protein
VASDGSSLLSQITHCAVAERCLNGEHLACSAIVRSQAARTPQDFQVPEPWSGHIDRAPILFVSSNPSIDRTEEYPARDWDDARRADFFAGRFDQRPVPWIDDKMRPLLATTPSRRRDRGVPFWFAARARATELLERPAKPGRDFVLTEVVHCKSESEHGVANAFPQCVQTWLRPVIRLAAARVIVLFGAYARRAFDDVYRIPPGAPLTGPRDLEGSDRIVIQLPHPNARGQKANCHPLAPGQLETVRSHLLTKASRPMRPPVQHAPRPPASPDLRPHGPPATVTVTPAGMIKPSQITDRHVITRCIAAPPQYPHNDRIVIVFAPGTAVTGQSVFRHATRGSNLGTYSVISRTEITAADSSRLGVRFYTTGPDLAGPRS